MMKKPKKPKGKLLSIAAFSIQMHADGHQRWLRSAQTQSGSSVRQYHRSARADGETCAVILVVHRGPVDASALAAWRENMDVYDRLCKSLHGEVRRV